MYYMILFCCIIDRNFFDNFDPETNINFKNLAYENILDVIEGKQHSYKPRNYGSTDKI